MSVKVKFNKILKTAEVPSKVYPDDAGLDITIVERKDVQVDKVGEVTYFRTGLIFEPEQGFHIKVYERSSLHKYGYSLATGVSIIDPGYRGELLIPLLKVKEVEDLTLPFKPVQIILEKTFFMQLTQENSLTPTERGNKGFGSTTNHTIIQHKLPIGKHIKITQKNQKQTFTNL